MIELKPAINEVKLTLKSISRSVNMGTVVEPSGGSGVPTNVREAIYTLLDNAAYATTGLEDEIAIVQNWAQEVTALSLDVTSLTLNNDTPQTITATVVPSGSTITWTSSDTSVATVVGGVVTGVANGSCVITATAGSKSVNCAVTVSGFATLESISAVYTQSGTVYNTDSLDSLKADLVVTATYSDTSTATVPSNSYSLSGTLEVGTSTITVTYQGKTTTFNVTVTSSNSYVTNGLIHYWDGIDNTGSGHNSSATTWKDLAGSMDLSPASSEATWTSNALSFPASSASGDGKGWSADSSETPSGKTVEVVVTIDDSRAENIAFIFPNTLYGKFSVFTDNSFNANGNSATYSYPTGLSAITKLHNMCVYFSGDTAIGAVYGNGTLKTVGSATHSMTGTHVKFNIGGGTAYLFKGKVHAVRIYNRQLTAEEVAHNYAIDVDRFGFGS